MANRETNELTIVSFRLIYRLTECFTIIHKKQVFEFQQRKPIMQDVSISSQSKRQLGLNLQQQLKLMDAPPTGQAQASEIVME